MVTRVIVSAIITFVISIVAFGVATASNPRWLELYEPVFCEEGQTLETRMNQIGSTTEIGYICTGDGVEDVSFQVFLAALVTFFVPVFPFVWLLSFLISARSRGGSDQPQASVTGFPAYGGSVTGNVQAFTMTSSHTTADSNAVTETLALVQEALSDGVITREEFERINAQVSNTGGTVTTTSGDKPLTTRLSELHNAYAQGFITQAEYDRKRRDILDEF